MNLSIAAGEASWQVMGWNLHDALLNHKRFVTNRSEELLPTGPNPALAPTASSPWLHGIS
jgi:hypothetical protein